MRIDENFIANFLQNIMKGVVNSKQKKFMKDNPDVAKKVKELDKIHTDLQQMLRDLD